MLKKLKISETNTKILKMLFITFFIAMAIGFLFIKNKMDYLYYGIGLALGILTCSFKMVLLEKMLDKAISMDEKSAQKYVVSQFAFRHFIQFTLLIGVALTLGGYGLFGALASFACLTISVYTANFFIKDKPTK